MAEASSSGNVAELEKELQRTQELLNLERRRSGGYAEELRLAKEQAILVHKQVEQEEEFITNRLMKRLSQLKRENQNLANEVEQEEEYLTNTLQKRLAKLNSEKLGLEKQLEVEQEYIVNKLQKKLDELSAEKSKLSQEKVDLENQLEAEQEYIVNKLQKQVDKLAREKRALQKEKSELQRTVGDLGSSVTKLGREKCALENEMEMEEEGIVNRLQRQLEHLMAAYNSLKAKVEPGEGDAKDATPVCPLDTTTEWVYGRSSSTGSASSDARLGGLRRGRTSSVSSSGSLPVDLSRGPVTPRIAGRDLRKLDSMPLCL